jgi:CelD/BcsL family acetyltransferase involved in cellulose biosynthesis
MYSCGVPSRATIDAAPLAAELSVAADLASIADEWDELAERVGASPFLRPGWFTPWLAAFGCGTPQAILVRRDGELAGVLPMQRLRGRLHSAANWHSPVFGPVAADEQARALLLDHVFDSGPAGIELSLLNGDGLHITQAARRAGRLVLHRTIASSPVVGLDGCFDSYERTLTRNRRRSLRRGRRTLESHGDVSFDVHEGLAGLPHALNEIFELEGSGWKGREGTAMASRPETARFYSEIAHWAAEQGWLRLSFLRLDGRAIACDFSFEFGGTLHSLKSGYDETYRAAGPGALLLHEQLRDAFDRGLDALDLLGHTDSFKRSWAHDADDRIRVHAFQRNPVGLMHWSRVAAREGARPAMSWMRARVRSAKARTHHAIGSLAAQWESLGLELTPGLV